MRSHISCATSSVCVLMRIATPCSLIRLKTLLMSFAPRGSRPDHRLVDQHRLRAMEKSGAHDEPLLHAVREALDELVLPPAELEQIEHLAHALVEPVAVDAVQAGVKPQKLAGGELLVDVRADRE